MHRKRNTYVVAAIALAQANCGLGYRVPWPRPETSRSASHAEVSTVNSGYDRLRGNVLVRRIEKPTRANLDWAAYHANFMNADPAPEPSEIPTAAALAPQPFRGLLDPVTLTGSIEGTPLTADERNHPLAFAPLTEFLSAKRPAFATGLEDVAAAVRAEAWGQPGPSSLVRQAPTDLFVHTAPDLPPEIWLKIEFPPWWKALGTLPDEDGDGFPEIYGRLRAGVVSAEAVAFISADYAGRVLSGPEVKAWANQLSSYWYPSYNTDLIPATSAWPDDQTEGPIRAELKNQSFLAPTIVLRGKPQGKATYNVFLVPTVPSLSQRASATAKTGAPAAGVPTTPPLVLPPNKITPHPERTRADVQKELAAHGKTWEAWAAQVAPFRAAVRSSLKATPPKAKGLAGTDGFLFYRTALESVIGGDFEAQAPGKNPVPAVVDFQVLLAGQKVDFLFVPVPNKVEIFPDKLDPALKPFVGQVVNPFERKLVASLATKGVEILDLWPTLLAARLGNDDSAGATLFQRQDTHWSPRGLDAAAHAIAVRIKQYPWYADLARHKRVFATKDAPINRYGDLHSRLPENLKRRYKPEALVGQQVQTADGTLYDDDPDSPVVLLGDSFTGVFGLTDCEHAGVSAHIAREIGYPVDLVMSYGGGPNVRQKLMRRGQAALASKRLVIWMMTARDLHNYWEDWEVLKPASP